MPDDLTPRQHDILNALADAVRERGYPPSVRELGEAAGLHSPATVHAHLRQLEAKGYIRRVPGHPRALEVRLPAGRRAVPVVGRVAAGPPLLAVEERAGALPPAVAEDASFALTVRGDSMIGAGIQDGDTVLVRRQDDADNGALVVALVDDEATVKRLRRTPDGPVLVAENPAYAPIAPDNLRILGVVVGLYRRIS
jgi:repressor LexA